MHRSRLCVLVIFAAAAACSTHDDSEAIQLLSKDPALGARLEVAQDDRQLALPDACGTGKAAAQPSAEKKTQAEELTRQASKSEIIGNVKEARTLLRRAAELDATNTSAAYHLGRTSEELGDSTAATTAYCRLLTLSPSTAESADARERVSRLARSVTSVASGSVSDSVGSGAGSGGTSSRGQARPTKLRSPTRTQSVSRSAVRTNATVTQPARSASSAHGSQRIAVAERSGRESAKSGGTAAGVQAGDSAPEHVVASSTTRGDDVAPARPAQSDDQSSSVSTVSRPASRGPNRMQSAGIGAATGAILGAVTGRSMKSAVIGAAAGGILGTLVGHGGRPIGSGTFH